LSDILIINGAPEMVPNFRYYGWYAVGDGVYPADDNRHYELLGELRDQRCRHNQPIRHLDIVAYSKRRKN